MLRLTLQIVTTAIFVSNVVSLAWFLYEVRNQAMPRGKQAALALTSFFIGLLMSQLYMVLVTSWVGDGGDADQLSPFWPVAVLAVLGILGGGAWLAWLFRPHGVPVYIWALSVTLLGLALGAARWAIT